MRGRAERGAVEDGSSALVCGGGVVSVEDMASSSRRPDEPDAAGEADECGLWGALSGSGS